MPILHMETDGVRGAAKQLQQTAEVILEQTRQLSTTIESLSHNWQGPSAEIFVADMHPIIHLLNRLCDAGTILSQRLHRSVRLL